jgi:ketosteroid isomerase-like protein
VRIEPLRVIVQGDAVVVEQAARWQAATEPMRVASAFRVRDGRVASVVRYADLAEAESASR